MKPVSLRNQLVITVLLVLLLSLIYSFLTAPTATTKNYSDFQKDVMSGLVTNVESNGTTLTVTLKDNTKYTSESDTTQTSEYATIQGWLTTAGLKPDSISYKVDPSSDNGLLSILLFTVVPFLLIGGILFIFLRQAQRGNNQALSFGKSKARLSITPTTKITFADVAGVDEAKVDLQEVVEFLKYPEKFESLGAKIPRGVLLVGATGVGKTLMAKAVAGEASVPFLAISGSEFVELFVGVGASVTGDTLVLIRNGKKTELLPISEFVDRYYQEGKSDFVVSINGIETLGYESGQGYPGKRSNNFEGSAWKAVRGVLRHRTDEIYEVEYLGGKLRTTGDHSVFVRGYGGIKTKMTRELKPGDVLVDLPSKVRQAWDPIKKQTSHRVRAHSFEEIETQYLEVVPRNERVENNFAFAIAQRGSISQYAIAAQIGVSQSTVGLWQRGINLPREITPNYTDVVLPGRIEVTPDLMRLLGYYTAEGRASGSVCFTFGTHETDLIADCAALGERIFRVKATLRPQLDNSTRVIFYSAALGRFFAEQCGNGSHNKHIPPILWQMPRECFLAYLTGYTLGDGYIDPKGRTIATSVSHQLIRELTWLCAMHGIKTGSRRLVSPGGRIIKAKPLPETVAWSLIIGATSASEINPKSQGTPKRSVIRKVTKLPYNGYVYDLVGCENEAFFGGESPLLLHNSRVRDLFDQAKRNSPAIIFIDELDSIGRHRGSGLGNSNDEREQTLNQILVEMDGFDTKSNVIVIAATNRPDILDPALLRPGRFDRQVVLDKPDVRGRLAILQVHIKGKPLDKDVSLETLAHLTIGFSGADLANLTNEGAILAARNGHKVITQSDLTDALDRIAIGPERKSRLISDEEKRIIAIHEGGHALVQRMLPKCDPVSKVTILGRGLALGFTASLPAEDRYLQSRSEFRDKLAGLLAGNTAEQIMLGDTTTGASNDIEKATQIARAMVTKFGMSEKLGPVTFGRSESSIFLNREINEQRDYSDSLANQIDVEIKALIEEAQRRAHEVVTKYQDRLNALVDRLIVVETLEAEEFEKLFVGLPKDLTI